MRIILVLIILFLPFTNALAQSRFDTVLVNGKEARLNLKNPEGNEFLLCFMQNYDDENIANPAEALKLELFITGDFDANVQIDVKAIRFSKEIFVQAGTVKTVRLDQLAQVTSQETIDKGKAVHITSDMPISVYGLSTRHETTDTFLGLPNNVIGKEYRVMCYHKSGPRMPEFAVVATEDNTEIEITPRVETKLNRPANVPFKITMDKGDVYQVIPATNNSRNMDLTGSHIKANKNISVFSGHQCAYVPAPPPQILACNHLAEQMPPLSSWGKHFFVGKLQKRTKYTYRVLADQEATKVFINSKLTAILQPGQFYESISDSVMQITADKPILVAQYSQGYRNGDLIGDPMMLLISPTQQFLKHYRFATPINGFWNHFINVVVPTKALSSLKLNNKQVDSLRFKQIGLSRYSIGYLQVEFGTHFIASDEPFGMYSYGFGFGDDAYDAYGTMGGQSFIEYVAFPDMLSPSVEVERADTGIDLIARDDRINDSGIKSIKEVEGGGLKIVVKNWDEGTPQVPLKIVPINPNELSNARLVFKVEDMSENTSYFTVCYNANAENLFDVYNFAEGINEDCSEKGKMTIGAFGKFSLINHSVNFYEFGDLKAQSPFSDANGFGGYFGIELSKEMTKKFTLTGRLSYDSFRGELISPDTVIQHIREPDPPYKLINRHESYSLELNNNYISLSLLAQWKLSKYVYLSGGLNFSYALFGEPTLKRINNYPSSYVYANGTDRIELNNYNLNDDFASLISSIQLGTGINLPINIYLTAFSELNYNYFFTSLNYEDRWRISNLSLLFGFKLNTNVIF